MLTLKRGFDVVCEFTFVLVVDEAPIGTTKQERSWIIVFSPELIAVMKKKWLISKEMSYDTFRIEVCVVAADISDILLKNFEVLDLRILLACW